MTYTRLLLTALLAVVMTALPSHAQQLPNNGFEDGWVDCKPYTGGETTTVDVKTPKSWTIAHVAGYKFLGMWMGKTTVGEQVVGYNNSGSAVKIINSPNSVVSSQTVPGYITLGTTFNTANTSGGNKDGGSFGGINFNHRPDALSFRYQRYQVTTPATIVAYLWKGSWSQANVRVSIGSSPTKVTMTDRERNILGIETAYGDNPTSSSNAKRIATINVRLDDNNETEWKEISYKFIYETDDTPEKINVIFGAGDYFSDSPEVNNSLTIDDVKLIYYSRLESLSVGGVPVPGFSSDKFEYDLTDTAFPTNTTVNSTKLGGGQSATVGAPQIDKASSTIKITVTGVDDDTDGEKTHTYTLRYKPFKAELSKVKINGTEYMVSGNNIILSTPWIDGMNVEPIVNTDCSGTPKAVFDAASKTITVTNEAASLKNTYTLTFAQPSYSKLQSLSVAGVAVPGFNPDKFDYDLTTTKFPEDPTKVTAIPMSEGRPATVGAPVVDRENATIKIKVTSADKESENTYTLKYMPFKAELSKVKINGTEYNATSNSINISLPWADGMTVEPIVNTNCSGTPKAVFDAASKTITVTNEAASLKNTYTLTFAQPSYSKLQSLSVAGVAVPGFNPDKFDYDLTTTKFPEDPTKVTAVPMSEGKPATVGAPVVDWKNATIKIIVTSADNESEHTYTLKYMPFKAELSKVKINGTEYNVNGTTITIGIAWSEEMIVEPMVNSECSGSPKAVFDPITKKITVTNVPASLTKTYTLIFEQPYYSRISSITIGDATYIVSADGKTVDATSLPLPMPENESITVNILSGGQGKPTVTAKNRWVRDTEKGTVTFTVTNSEPDTDGAKSHTYTIQFPTPVVSRLKNIGLDAEWEPEFSPTVYDYRVEAFTPATDDELRMELYPDCNITPSVERLEPDGKTQTVKITLKGDGPDFDGKDQHSYTIVFNTPSDEYRSSLLTKLSVKGIAIEPFSPRTYRYSVSMPIPENITHDDLDVEFYSTETAPNDGTDYEIESVDINKAVARIRVFNDEYPDESGAYDHTYIIQFLPYYSRLNSISIGEMTEEVFTETGENIEVHFAIKMPAAEEIVLTLPEKTAGNIAVGQITMDQDKAIAMVTVSNDKPDTDGLDKRTYTLCFAMPHFSRLASITIDGDIIPEFNPNTYSYQIPYVMPENPQIEAVAMEGGQGTPIVSEPEIDPETNTVTITVTNTRPDTDGENSHTYVMTFMAKPTAKLAAIAIDGVDIKDFNPDIYDYTLTGLIPAAENITATILPTTGNITEPTITLNQQTATATITVTNGELKGVYTLRFELPCPTTIKEIKVAGVSLDKFNSETLTYEIEVEKLPAESDITVTLTDNRATATVTLNDDSTRAEIKVTSPLPAIGEENTKIYTLIFSIIPDNTGEPDEPQTPEKPDKPQKPENPTPSDNTITYGGMLTIMMMGEDLTNGGQEARVEIEDGEEGLCTFRLPDFSLDLGDGPASLGDIVVENVKVTTAPDGARTYEGEVKGMELAEGAIIADVTLTGTADASGKAHMVIKVNWEGIDIDVEFNGQAEEKPEVPVTPAPADGTTIYNGMLTIMMMGEDLTKGGQEARVEIEDGEEGLCTFRLPDFSLDLGDGPASLGDIVVENVKVTTAPDGSKTFEGNVEGMELAEGAIIADVTLSGTADSEGMAQMVIKVNWEGIDIDVEFNGQAEEKPEVPVTPTPGDSVWDLTEGIITVEMNGYDITEGGTPATLHTARMDDGKYTFMVPDFMLALDADNTPANLGDIVVNGITASQLSGSLTRYTGTVDNLSLAGGSIAANASIDGTIAADGTTVINVDVEWIMEDGRHVPIMVRFTNTPRSNNTAEDESYSGVMTAEIEGEPIRTFGVLLRISPHSPGRCNMTIEGFDFSPASRAAGLGHTINIPGVCVTPLADGMTGYDGNTSGISVSAGITVDAILHGFTTETGHHSLSLDLLWAEQGVRIAGTFDGHIDVTAIDAPGSDRTDNDENAEWYNMQGIRVNGANLRPGVYIKRTATKTEKIIISE